ncbi:glycosyltransferase [Luteolibacter luteus]|uniref:Glycosyltransferase n=1 Tax=Luteolibacter luteus TaxID=2728835 RepID=A0A858RNU4_9BACT|nr:glycosyltransferase [Luteolibacter luteus]QJE98532.1 glycosyltransferase [Luteolibacter luteus]
MHCLWITRQDPRPANSGELIYTLGLLGSLAKQPETELTVLAHRAAAGAEGGPPVHWELHGKIPGGRLKSLLSELPGDAFRLGNPVQRQALSLLLGKKWDWIVIDQAACAWALGMIGTHQKVAYIAHNHEAAVRKQVASDRGGSLPMRMALKWDALKYARMERALCRRADLISAITPRDTEAFGTEFPGKPVCTLPPGYQGEAAAGAPREITSETPRRVVLAGAFEWVAKRRNLEAFLNAAAESFQRGKIGFQVVGKADPEWFAALAKQHPWASFTANVPSISPYLDQARIGLIPEALGGGFKLKALDYIFRGLPLASVEAALSGVPVNPQTEAIAAPDPESLTKAVAAKIDDLAFLNHAARRALDACRDAFHWEDRGVTLRKALGNPESFRA